MPSRTLDFLHLLRRVALVAGLITLVGAYAWVLLAWNVTPAASGRAALVLPDDPRAAWVALLALDGADDAVPHFRALVDASPRDAARQALLGAALLASGDVEASRSRLETARACDRSCSLAYMLEGDLALEAGDMDGASRAYQRAVETSAGQPVDVALAQHRRGAVLLWTGAEGAAVEAFEAGLRAAGAEGTLRALLLTDLALVADVEGRRSDAIRCLEQACSAAPNRRTTHLLVTYLLRTGEASRALQAIDAAASSPSRNPRLQGLRVQALEAQGQRAQARAAAMGAWRVRGSPSEVARAWRRLH